MSNGEYDKGVGSENRSVVAATKTWAIVLAVVAMIGIGILVLFFNSGSWPRNGGPASENTTTRPAKP